jgi:conserved oligomeric Golgi complex subunit 4
MFAKYKTHLVEDNFDTLVQMCVRHLNKLMESAIMQIPFSQLGALQFDKDLRKIITYFTSITNRSVRGEFARLIQIASLLNLEKVSEVLDYWGENSGQMTWRLAPSEVRRVLSRRNDFSGEQIASLKLQ